MHLGFDLAFAHSRLQPFVLDPPHGRIANAGGLLQQFNLVARLYRSRFRHRRPAVHDFQAVFLEGFERRHVQVIDADILLGQPVLLQDFHNAVRHSSRHVGHCAFSPLPGNRRTDAALHPRQIDLGALQIRPRRFEKHRFAAIGHHGVANVDVVFPISLIGSRGVTYVRPRKQDQRPQIRRNHLLLQLRQTLFPQPVEIHPVLPIRPGLAVQPARIPLVRLPDKTRVEPRTVHRRRSLCRCFLCLCQLLRLCHEISTILL